jgi:hypothetical protein
MTLALLVAGALPAAARDASGLPPSITLDPLAPGPGASVTVTGLDFPPEGAVELSLVTTDRIIPLGAVESDPDGVFRASVTLPEGHALGVWQVRAVGAGDAAAVRLFRAAEPASASGTGAGASGAGSASPASVAARADGSAPPSSDLIVMLILVGLALAIVAALAGAWLVVRRGDGQQGLPSGDDLIWSGTTRPPS